MIFLGMQPDVDAGATEPVRLDDRSAGTMQRRPLRAREAAAPATDDNQIELLGHCLFLWQTGGWGEHGIRHPVLLQFEQLSSRPPSHG